jgi:hypothetical protein
MTKLKAWGAVFTCAVIWAATARSESPQAQEKVNVAPNGGFEEPAGSVGAMPSEPWSFFTTKANGFGITRDNKRSGEQCLKISAQKAAGAFQGLILDLPVAEGEKYTFSAYITNDREDPIGGSASGQLVIEWKGPTGKEVARSASTPWTAGLSRMRWDQVTIGKTKVPDGAVRGVFGIHLNEGTDGGKGSMYVDDVVIEKQ